MNQIIWFKNPLILFTNYSDFIPNLNMNEEKLYNSLVRLMLYIMIIIFFIIPKHYNNLKKNIYYICLIIIVLTIPLYYINLKDEHFINIYDDNKEIKDNVITGFYDSNNELKFDRINSLKHKDKLPFSNNLYFECRKPTEDNPFMNPTINDYDTETVPVACNSSDKNITEEMKKKFYGQLYKNVEDVFNEENSFRQFYTVPNTYVPNNQTEFARWLYGTKCTCKEDQEHCLRYEDVRFKTASFF